MASWYDSLEIWRRWADDGTGAALDGGHFLPAEAPEETVRQVLGFG